MKREDILNLFDLTGKVALVTGATGALGSTASKAFAALGAKVMLTGRTESRLKELVEEITQTGGTASYIKGDPLVYEDVERIVKETSYYFSGIDILLTAAGINNNGPIDVQPREEWELVMDLNVKGTYYFCKEVGKVMKEQERGGKIILVGSVRGSYGLANYTAYCASKGAVHMLTKSLAMEFGPYGINVNCIAPGVFRSGITRRIFEDQNFYNMVITRFPLGRLGEPEDLVGVLVFLASKASDWVTGAIFYVDGGYTAG